MGKDKDYFIFIGQKVPIKLIPMIKFKAPPETPETACYFYNRYDQKGMRWVTYHYEENPDFYTPKEDLDVIYKIFQLND